MTYKPNELWDKIYLYVNDKLSSKEKIEFEKMMEKNPELKKEVEEWLRLKRSYEKSMENIKVDKLKIYQKIKGGLDRTNRKNRMLSRFRLVSSGF